MRKGEEWLKTWICLSFVFAWVRAARPRFDVSTDMGMVLVPADAEVDTAIFRLRATDQDTDFPLVFEIIATTSPIVRVENLPCTLYNKVCQANVILTRRLVAGRLHDFVVRVRDSKGDVNSMQATISVTNSTTPRDKIFPHLPTLIMVPEDTKPEKELDYLLVESNPWSGKPVYIELWQPKELFKIRQRQIGSQTKGIITLIADLDFETQSMYTLTMYATDPYTEPGKDTRNIAGLHVVVIVQDVQDVPPVFTLAPPLTKINNSIQPGDLILRVHAEDGDKGVPRDVTYGLISEGNPFTPFFNVSETTGEIRLAKPLEELTKIIHVGAPIVLKIVAEEIRSMRDEPPSQATIVELGLLVGEPGNTPPYFENDNYVAWMDENAEPGTVIAFTNDYSTRVKDEDIGKAGVFALKLENNNGTFEVSPAVTERTANFVITVRDNILIDYEKFRSLRFMIVAQEVGPATNLSASVPVIIFLKDVNDNIPIFDNSIYNVTLVENSSAGTKVIQVHATDNDTGTLGKIQYTKIIGNGSEAFDMNPDNGLITVSLGSILDREQTPKLELTVEARDEDGRGLRGTATLIVNILDVNDNAPVFEKGTYEFLMNPELKNFTIPIFLKALDADAEPPNNVVRYEIIHGNYENKFQLNDETGELTVREPIDKSRKVRHNYNENLTLNMRKQFKKRSLDIQMNTSKTRDSASELNIHEFRPLTNSTGEDLDLRNQNRSRRAETNPLFILTVRAYDLGVPHLSNTAQIRIMPPMSGFARIVMFVMPGENPDPTKTAETLATITGSRVTIQEIKPYVSQVDATAAAATDIGKRSVVVARVEQNGPGTLVDVDKIRASLTANGFGIISGMDNVSDNIASPATDENTNVNNVGRSNSKNISVIDSTTQDVTVYKTENKLLTWLLILLGLSLLAAIITLIICCTCPSCPFYMEPRKRRIHSSETLVIHSDGRPKRHLHRKPIKITNEYYGDRKEAWSADPSRQNWQFNRRNTKNLGIASLPGDFVSGYRNPEIERLRRVASLRLRDDETRDPSVFGEQLLVRSRVANLAPQNDGIFLEDVDSQNRNYEQAELDSLRKQELERGSDGVPVNEPIIIPGNERLREQHFYRDGNVEILRLITRGEIEDYKNLGDGTKGFNHANAKDILLQRFIEDQKLRRSQDFRDSFQESFHEADVNRSMESHQRANEIPEILILPEKLELPRQPVYNQRQHQQEQMLNPDVRRLISERNYQSKDFKDDEGDEYRSREALKASMRDVEMATGEVAKGDESTSYVMHDVELVRQNALLTRLLLEKETRTLNVPMVDSSSFLETQSLPGHVAIATQTDRTTATQTEGFGRSRSDNEELEDDQRTRRRSKPKEQFETKEDFKKLKTIWVRTPIPEESRTLSGNKMSTPTRTKIEVTESCKVSISPDVLKEVSSSLKSSESGCNGEDEDQESLTKRSKVKLDIMQKAYKLSSKVACTSKKKMKEAKTDNDSTTGSPEIKDKNILMKSKIRKKTEKPMQAKKLEKKIKSEKSHFMEPSFRVLEREISNFHQKIREFGDKKLKIAKKDSGKTTKESKHDSGTIYDVSKKCEITVNKIKNSISSESSPIKISVEEKPKSSEKDSSTKDQKIEVQSKQSNSSLELEDYNKSSRQSLSLTEKVMESSKMQTRSRSKLRRQAQLQNFDSKSESEKIEKSEDSESKTNKLKGSTSSLEMKVDSTSCSSRDFGKHQKPMESQKISKSQVQEKKSMRTQKLTTKLRPTGIVDLKRKVFPVESKSTDNSRKRIAKRDEKLDIHKSSTSDDSKSISTSKSVGNAYHTQSNTSEEEKSNKETKLSITKELKAVDLDKLVEEVKGTVEKEISSFTEAAKDALNVKKSNLSVTDNVEKRSKSPFKLKKAQKIESSTDKKQQEIDILQGTEENNSKLKERRDSREKMKDLGEKSKFTENISATKLKSDDEISFIVIDKKKMAPSITESLNKSNVLEQDFKILEHSNQDGKRIESGKNDTKILNTKSKELSKEEDESKQILSDKIETTENVVNDEVDEMKKITLDKNDESKKLMLDGITEKINIVSDGIADAKQNALNNFDQTKETVTDKIDETGKCISDTIIDTKEIISDSIDESTKITSNKINETQRNISDTVDDTKKILSDTIDKTTKIVFDNIDENEKNIVDVTHETKNIMADEINDTKKVIDSEVNEIKNIIMNEINDTEKMITKDVDESKTSFSDKIDDTEKNVTDIVDKIKQTITDKIDKTEKDVVDEIDKFQKNTSDKISAIETSFLSAIVHEDDDSKENISEKILENNKAMLNNDELNVQDEEEILKSVAEEMSFEQKDETTKSLDTDLKSKDIETTVKSIDDSANNKLKKNGGIVKEVENYNSEQNLLKLKSTSLPDDIKDYSETQSLENQNKIIEETKVLSEGDTSKNNEESFSILDTKNSDNTSTLELQNDNVEKSTTQKEEPCKKKSISLLNGSFKEKDAAEVTETKEPIEHGIHEGTLSNEDDISQSNLNKSTEISLAETTELKETEESETQQKQETDEKEIISLNIPDNRRDTIMESSAPMHAEDQTSAVEIISAGAKGRDKLIFVTEESRGTASSSLRMENKKETNSSMKDFYRQLDDSKKTIFELPNAISAIALDCEESDNDSSSATDISNKTALHTKPYRTPRHSISSDDIEDTSTAELGKTLSSVQASGKTRQKWSSEREQDPILQVAVEELTESSIIVLPQKMEMTSSDKPKILSNKTTLDQTKMQKSPAKESQATSTLLKSINSTESKMSNSKQHTETPRTTRPVTVSVKKKAHLRKMSPGRERASRIEDKKSQRQILWENRSKAIGEQRKVEIRSRHLKLHVSHRTWQPKEDSSPRSLRASPRISSPARDIKEETAPRTTDHGKDSEVVHARSRYMAWYQQKRTEMERKRRERKEAEQDQSRSRWLKPKTSVRSRKAKSAEDIDQNTQKSKVRRLKERAKSSSEASHSLSSSLGRSSLSRLRIRPLVNVESEQLKAIVRQGRKLRKAEGAKEEPEVQIFVPEKPPQPPVDILSSSIQLEPRHHLTQHSEYKYEKEVQPLPFYLHPPPVSHSLQQQDQDNSSANRRVEDDLDSGIAVSVQGGTRLRHQQLLEKKSVFDIAYSEAAPTQLRSDSSTPPT